MSKYFKIPEEITCNCGCGASNISFKLIQLLDDIREEWGHPLKLNSACRCPAYNAAVGGVGDSAHITTDSTPCEAVDIRCTNSLTRLLLVRILLAQGVRRMGLSKDGFIHIDIDGAKPQDMMWIY